MKRALEKTVPVLRSTLKGLRLKQHAPACNATWQQRAMATESKVTGSSSVFVVNVEGRRNVSPLLIGLFDFLERYVPRPGFFQVRRTRLT